VASALPLDEGEDGVLLEADRAADPDVADPIFQEVRLSPRNPEDFGDLGGGE
jgi:hypothetical protein